MGTLNLGSATFQSSGANLVDAPPGSIIQVVSNTYTTSTSNTTATFADTGLSATISISANSKVLILVTQPFEMRQNAVKMRGDLRLMRGSTEIYGNSSHQSYMLENQTNDTKYLAQYVSLTFLDTGASAGSNTYKIQGRVTSASDSSRVRFQDDSNPSTMTLLEIAA